MKRILRLILILTLATIFLSIAPALAQEPVDEEQPPEAAISFTKQWGVIGIILDIELKADVETVWGIITNPDNAPKMFEKLTIHPVKDKKKLREYQLDSPLGAWIVLCELSKDDEEYKLEWKRIRGDFKAFRGIWQLDPDSDYEGYIHARYTSFVDPGGLASRFLTKNRRRERVLAMSKRLTELVAQAVEDKRLAAELAKAEAEKATSEKSISEKAAPAVAESPVTDPPVQDPDAKEKIEAAAAPIPDGEKKATEGNSGRLTK